MAAIESPAHPRIHMGCHWHCSDNLQRIVCDPSDKALALWQGGSIFRPHLVLTLLVALADSGFFKILPCARFNLIRNIERPFRLPTVTAKTARYVSLAGVIGLTAATVIAQSQSGSHAN